jgi:hypothetical protein
LRRLRVCDRPAPSRLIRHLAVALRVFLESFMKCAFLSLLVISVPLVAGKKPAAEPPQTWPSSRTFAASCDSVWPVALQVFVSNGWAIKSSDRAGGTLSLEWTRGEWHGNSSRVNPFIARNTTEPVSSFWHQWTDFRIMPSSVITIAADSGCTYTIALVYHGHEIGVDGYRVLQSNGFFETAMLSEIEGGLPNHLKPEGINA